MKINPNQRFAGQPIMKVRDLLRSISDTEVWGIERVEYGLDVNRSDSNRVISELLKAGYIEEDPNKSETTYSITIKGNSFAMASAAPSLHRATADARLDEFMGRVEEVRDDPHYIYKVSRVLIFGSYLDGERDRINDIDLAIELIRKEPDLVKHNELRRQRIAEAHKEGRRFRNIIEELGWPEIEVWRYLKSRKRSLSLHRIDDGILDITRSETLFEDP